MISLELDGSYPWPRIEISENALAIDNICFSGVHSNNGGIKSLVENICHCNIKHKNITFQHHKIQFNLGNYIEICTLLGLSNIFDMIFSPFVFAFCFLGNVKHQVYIKQRYLIQLNKKHDKLENVLIYFQIMLMFLILAAVRTVLLFLKNIFCFFVVT